MSFYKIKKLPISFAVASLAFSNNIQPFKDANAFYYGGESV
jgi:hypothetical protein